VHQEDSIVMKQCTDHNPVHWWIRAQASDSRGEAHTADRAARRRRDPARLSWFILPPGGSARPSS